MEFSDELFNLLTELNKLNYSAIVSVCMPIIQVYVTSKIIHHMNLHENYKLKKINVIKSTTVVTPKYTRINDSNFENNSFKDAIIKFVKTLEDNFAKEDLNNLYNNINSLIIKNKNFYLLYKLFRYDTEATYSEEKNLIEIDCKMAKNAIYHELFHLASSMKIGKDLFSGFKQYDGKKNSFIAKGLNEGYTQLLSERYFGDIPGVKGAYVYLTDIAFLLEKVIGKEKMEKYYLNADLMGLVNEMKKYADEESVMHFITYCDFMEIYETKGIYSLKQRKLLENCNSYISTFLCDMYKNKLEKDVSENKINEETRHILSHTFLSSIIDR